MKRLKKLSAMVSAIAVTTTMVSAMMPANAASVSPVPASAFSYELLTEMVSDTQLKVTFQVTNNPGLHKIGIALLYDEKCQPNNVLTHVKNGVSGEAKNPNLNLLTCGIGILPHAITGETESFENFSVDFYFSVDKETVSSYEFSASVFEYASDVENVNHELPIIDGYYPSDITIETYPYTLGDVDNDGRIKIEDASAVYSITAVNNAVNENDVISVDCLNYNIEHNVISTIIANGDQVSWGDHFSYLMRSGHSYAEAADVDRNGYIENTDGDAILQFYADTAAALPVDTLIGKTQVKTITVNL